jgi:hypothetical protein
MIRYVLCLVVALMLTFQHSHRCFFFVVAQVISPSSFKAIKETINKNFQDTAYILFYRRIPRSHPAFAAYHARAAAQAPAGATPTGTPVRLRPLGMPRRTGSNDSVSSAMAIGTPPMRGGSGMPPPPLAGPAGLSSPLIGSGFHRSSRSIAESARSGHTLATLELASEGPQSVIDDNTRYLIHEYGSAFSDHFYWHIQQEITREFQCMTVTLVCLHCYLASSSLSLCAVRHPFAEPLHKQLTLSSTHSVYHPARRAILMELKSLLGPPVQSSDTAQVSTEVYAGLGLNFFHDTEAEPHDASFMYPAEGRRQLRHLYNAKASLAARMYSVFV